MDNLQKVPKEILFVKAIYNFSKRKSSELSFNKGDVIAVIEQEHGGWWKGNPESVQKADY
jgi:hypothetical protein